MAAEMPEGHERDGEPQPRFQLAAAPRPGERPAPVLGVFGSKSASIWPGWDETAWEERRNRERPTIKGVCR